MKQNSSRKTLQRIIGGAVVIAAGIIVYFSFLSQPDVELPPGQEQEKLPTLNTQALQDERIDAFHSWQSLPIEVGETGRNNPFSR